MGVLVTKNPSDAEGEKARTSTVLEYRQRPLTPMSNHRYSPTSVWPYGHALPAGRGSALSHTHFAHPLERFGISVHTTDRHHIGETTHSCKCPVRRSTARSQACIHVSDSYQSAYNHVLYCHVLLVLIYKPDIRNLWNAP